MTASAVGQPTSTAAPPRLTVQSPERAISSACRVVELCPMQSKAKSTPPPVAARTSSTGSPCRALTETEAPKRPAKSSFSSSRSTAMIGSAPRTAAAATAQSPTPPAPTTATELPAGTSAVLITAPAPVMTAQPMMLASPGSRSAGAGTTYSCRTRLWSDHV